MFINYDKLAEKIIEKMNYEKKEKIVNKISEAISQKLMTDEYINEISGNLNVLTYDDNWGHSRRISVEEFVAEKVAGRLVDDVYALNKAEILKEVSSQGILNVLQEKLQESAKQHVLDYITKSVKKK